MPEAKNFETMSGRRQGPRVKHLLAHRAFVSVTIPVTLLFTTPYLASSVLGSLTYIFMTGRQRGIDAGPLPPYPEPSARQHLFVILGEQHHALKPVPAAAPTWLTIPERGLFTGIAVIGAVGSGKTTGCLYPYAEQSSAIDEPILSDASAASCSR